MSSNKEIILAKREGYITALATSGYMYYSPATLAAMAKAEYPMPKITRPRTIDGLLGCRNTNRSYRFIDGVFMYSDTGDGHWHKSQWTPADIARLHDLMIDPLEEVEDTE